MKAIYKFKVSHGGFELMMPKGAEVLSVHTQHGEPQMWASVDTEAEKEVRKFSTFGTGHELPEEPGRFVGTFLMHGDSLVWHLFERTS